MTAAASAASGQRGIFERDQERAAAALRLTWGEFYEDIGVEDGWRSARSQDGVGCVLTGNTPDELVARMQADWVRRSTP